jgi:hypothetical protein
MNWGYKIAIVILVFVVGMLSMVYISMQQTNEMFDENYYAQELKYQSLIDAQNALNKIRTEPLFYQDPQTLTVQLPITSFESIQDGSIDFLKQDNQKDDLKYVLIPDSNGKFQVQKSELQKGVYKVRVKWTNQNQLYYSDESIFIQ